MESNDKKTGFDKHWGKYCNLYIALICFVLIIPSGMYSLYKIKHGGVVKAIVIAAPLVFLILGIKSLYSHFSNGGE